jgi:hypothetical protein
VTFVLSNFTSTAKSNGQNNFPNNDPNGTYVGPRDSECLFFAAGAERVGCVFLGSNAQGIHFVHFALNLQRTIAPSIGFCDGGACYLEFQASNKFPNNICNGFVARVPRTFTLQELVAGVQLTYDDFTQWSPINYPGLFNTSFDLFMQLNPLP